MTMTELYLEYKRKYTKKFGPYTAVLMQVGSFFELYEIENDLSEANSIGRLADIMDIQLTIKKSNRSDWKPEDGASYASPWFAGFPDYKLEKFKNILLDAGYRIILIEQMAGNYIYNKRGQKKEKREVTKIISRGTDLNVDQWEPNHILSLFVEEYSHQNKPVYSIGAAVIDLSTGESEVTEFNSQQASIFPEIHRIIKTYPPRELVLSSKRMKTMTETQFLEEGHLVDIPKVSKWNAIAPQLTKKSYQNTFLGKIFKDCGMLSPVEYLDLVQEDTALIAYVQLIDFGYEHSKLLVEQIEKPRIYSDQKTLILYNNAVSELDIYHRASNNCLFSILKKTSTGMGARLLQDRLLNPVTDRIELEHRYTLIDRLLDLTNIKDLEKFLVEIIDLKRYHRRLYLNRLQPFEFARLDISYRQVVGLLNRVVEIFEDDELNWLGIDGAETVKELMTLIADYSARFDLEQMQKFKIGDIEETIFQPGVSPEIDAMQEELVKWNTLLEDSRAELTVALNDPKGDVKLERKDKYGHFLMTTKVRYDKIKKTDTWKNGKYRLEKYPGNNVRIVNDGIVTASERLVILKEQFREVGREVYVAELERLHLTYREFFDKITGIVARIDVTKANSKTAIMYGYCRPELGTEDGSYVDSMELRHPIVERLLKDTEYIPNDVKLGGTLQTELTSESEEVKDGMILYGLNGGGKTVLSKSLAVNVIMAQAGLYVAATRFVFGPYHKVFTRISSKDNMFNGESSFTLEMKELRSILQYADGNSLVIGDEICRGTEHVSAMAIVMAAIQQFSKTRVQFIFATHLHELTTLDQMKALKNVQIAHLHVDVQNDIKYYRKLNIGPGPGLYGVEVMKHYIKDNSFVEEAFKVRNVLLNVPEKLVQPKASKYNADLFVHDCAICGTTFKETQLDVHHIKFQCTFDNNKMLGRFQKDEKSNLVVLCKEHHQDVHAGKIEIKGWLETSDGVKLWYENVKEEKKTKKKKEPVGSKYSKKEMKKILELRETKHMTQKLAVQKLKEDGIKISVYALRKIWKQQA